MKFVVIAVVMVVMAGFLHMMFIMYDYALHNPDSGMLTKLRESMNETLNTEARNRAINQTQMYREGFGWGRVICIGLALVIGPIELFKRPRSE